MTKWVILSCVILTSILQLRLWQGNGSLRDTHRLKQIIFAQTAELKRLTERNHQLLTEIQILKSHPNALEERARSELGMIKNDETFCLIVKPSAEQ